MPSRQHGESSQQPNKGSNNRPQSPSSRQQPSGAAGPLDAGFDFQPPQSQLQRSSPSKTLVAKVLPAETPKKQADPHQHRQQPQQQQQHHHHQRQQLQHRPSSNRRAQWAAHEAQQHYQSGAIMYARPQQPQPVRSQNTTMDLPRRTRDPYAPVDIDHEVLGTDVFNGPLGSFTEDSPPRGGSSSSDEDKKMRARRLPRNSPQGSRMDHPQAQQHAYSPYEHHYPSLPFQHHSPHPGAPPLSAGAPPPRGASQVPPPYPPLGRGPYPPQAYVPHGFYAYPPDHSWNSPPPLDDSQFAPQPVTESNSKMRTTGASPMRTGGPLLRASPTNREKPFGSVSTPDKKTGKIFRSPPSSRRSPPFPTASPTLGGYESFGNMIDTPGGTLAADFSPMGPSYAGLGDEHVAPSNDDFGGHQINLSGSNSSSEFGGGGPMIQQRPRAKADESPFPGFMNEFSPSFSNNMNVPRSPVHSALQGRRVQGNPPSHHSDRSRQEQQIQPPSAVKSAPRSDPRIAPRPSPALSASEAKPRKLWKEPSSGSAGAMRLELGTRTSSTQRSLEGINSMMRAQQQAAMQPHYSTPTVRPQFAVHGAPGATHSSAPRPVASHPSAQRHGAQPPMPHHTQVAYQPRMNTPMKSPAHMRAQPPQHYAPPASMTKQPPQPQRAFPSAAVAVSQPKIGTVGKENASGPKSRRGPCNCKKSKCLKLYCECFSQERFCDGCKCADCNNTPEFASIRDKAIKDTRAKNTEAFKPRITGGHNMGCKCKKSECLKKYCECFQAGVLCSSKCKCSSCMNHAGSQKLIDKRRKMKDTRGAAYAMQVAEESWKGLPRQRNPAQLAHHRVPMPSPAGGSRPMPGMHGMMAPGSHGRQGPPGSARGPSHFMGPTFLGPPHLGAIGYSPMSVPPITPGYGDPRMADASRFPHPGVMTAPGSGPRQSVKRQSQEITPGVAAPRTPGVRIAFNPSVSRKKRKTGDREEATLPYFGPSLPQQTKTAALAVFSFLSDRDVYKAAQVCKNWKRLAMDEELWHLVKTS